MIRTIQISLMVAVLSTGCAPEVGPPYRANDGRSGEFAAPGVAKLDQIVWKHRGSAAAAGPLALSADTAYLVTTNGNLTALDLADGAARWTTELGAKAYGTPVLAGARLLVGTDAGLVAIGLDGKEAWRSDGAPVETAPIVVDAVAYVGDLHGQLQAIDVVGGTLIWKAITAGPIRSSPIRVGRDIVVGSGDGGVYSVDLSTGEPSWSWNAPAAVFGISASKDRVFVSAGTEVISIQIDKPEASAWRTDVGAVVETPPSLSGGMVVVGTGAGTLTGLDTTDGSQLFQATLGAAIRGDIAVVSDRLAVPTSSRGIELVDRAGKAIWTFRTDGDAVAVSPMNNRLYVTDAEGSVYALQ